MILPMSRVRLIGPRDRLDDAMAVLQDFGRVQIDRLPATEGLRQLAPNAAAARERRALTRLRDDANTAIALLRLPPGDASPQTVGRDQLARWARDARHLRRKAERLRARRQQLDDERTLLGRYEDFLSAFSVLLGQLAGAQHLRVYGVTLPAAERSRVDTLADALREELGVEVVVMTRTLPSTDIAVLIAVPSEARERMERALGAARIAEVPLPSGYAEESLTLAAPKILARLADMPRLTQEVEQERAETAARAADDLIVMRTTATDMLAAAEATDLSSVTAHAFAIEGWIPSRDVSRLHDRAAKALGSGVVVEEVAREDWSDRDAPVVLSNPKLFRPFEVITSLQPLPAYGSIDPTPFVAVGFPMLFGMILGDVGYGVVLGALALLVLWRAGRTSFWRTVAQIALPCAAFAIIFGFLFGELFGELGRRWFGLRPIVFDREHAIVAAILVAVGIGVAHTVLGLILGVLASRRKPRVAISRAVQLGMIVLIVLAVLSAVHVLPTRLFGAFAIAVLVGFPVLLFFEGIVAPIEFLSTLSSVLSYVRIMALGTASVLLAAAANQMSGLFGSALVGVLFGLLFHLVNFAMGVFSPTIHALRLHYVEFFKHFYSHGGRPYEPFRHRGDAAAATPRGSS
jgi:V/A-type H+-transporting ATPase subunit I